MIRLLYKRDLIIENPKKFQRHVNDIASIVLLKKDYYLNGNYSKFPYLKPNGITNIADFHGLLCFVKNHSSYNLISRIIGVILIIFGAIHWIYPLLTSTYFNSITLWNPIAWIIIGVGIFLVFFKFGKDICIEIRLVGETYRTDTKKEENSIEYINVRSHARLTITGNTLDPTKMLSDKDIKKLQEDGDVLTAELDPFLKEFLEFGNSK